MVMTAYSLFSKRKAIQQDQKMPAGCPFELIYRLSWLDSIRFRYEAQESVEPRHLIVPDGLEHS
ncbi:hypothetical protein HKBW3S06_01403 [Candidatus Hakubella thermalkaliphila]|uniref:Uncharacterized protein n=1 Tax=Candidatus Hakubella thermalkaliphila TaxID=2754717 RepID=A0A6V8NUK5_9ACTN|nr:hypothetical protein HKBW3S06_01403 [Candidatus Hakubella thermalkaliphila]